MKYKCEHCGRTYTIQGHYVRHLAKEHAEKGANGAPVAEQAEKVVAFSFGYTQAWLEGHATSAGLSPAVLTARVAKLLLAAARGKMVGARD